MIKVPLSNPKPDAENFVGVITGKIIPEKPPLIELFLDMEIVREISTGVLERQWVIGEDIESQKKYFLNSIEVYYRMGYDCYRITGAGGLAFPGKSRPAEDTALLSRGTRHWAEEKKGPISNWDDFENLISGTMISSQGTFQMEWEYWFVHQVVSLKFHLIYFLAMKTSVI